MKWRILSCCGVLYVCFSILTAYEALGRFQAGLDKDRVSRVEYQGVPRADGYSQPLDHFDATTVDVSDEYFIEIWSSTTCEPCERFLERELPRLQKTGLRYKVFNIEMFPQPDGLKVTPTIKIYRGSILVKQFDGMTTLEKILEHIKTKVELAYA